MKFRSILAGLTLGATVLGITGVRAQATGEAPATATPSDSLEAITVTAQRRKELARDVPISLTAVSGADIEKAQVRSIQDLNAVAPGLNIIQTAAFTQPAIRGVATTTGGPGTEPNVATYIDDVYLPQSWMIVTEIPDVDRVEVLKGPQGTLFGRNAAGGALRIFTRDPEFQTSGFVDGSIGEYNTRGSNITTEGFFTTPVVPDVLAVSFSGFYRRDNGYLVDLVGNQDLGLTSANFRVKLLFKPTDYLTFKLTSYYSNRLDRTGDAGRNLSPDAYAPGSVPNRYQVAFDTLPFTQIKTFGTTLHGEASLPFGSITSTTSYSHADGRFLIDADGSPNHFLIFDVYERPNHNVQQEIIFSSNPLGPATFTVGGFYFDALDGFNPESFGATPAREDIFYKDGVVNRTQALAAFGEVNIKLTDRLTAIAGARYTHERKTMYGEVSFDPPAPSDLPQIASARYGRGTPRVSLSYALQDKTNIYASYSTGFQSGGFNTNSLSPIPVNPTTVRAYEIGVKSDEIRNLDLTLAFFFQDLKNVQVTADAGSTSVQILENAGAERMIGMDFDSKWKITPDFSIRGAFTYMPIAKWTSFQNAAITLPGGPAGTGINAEADLTGYRIFQAPEMQGTLSGTYSHQMGVGTLDTTLVAAYNSGFYFDIPGVISQRGNTLINGHIAYAMQNGLTLSIYGRNLTNKYTLLGALSSFAGFVGASAPPRELGVGARYSF